MKKVLALLLALAMIFCFVACGETKDPEKKDDPTEIKADDIADEMTSADGKYQIAFVTDVGQLKDKSFNQGTYDGVKLYAKANNKSYKYYQPANGSEATDDDRYNAMKSAVDNGAEIVVCAGFMQAGALGKIAAEHPEVSFVFIDGWAMGLANVAGIAFKEEQCGYLAGYACVKEGYTKLGFTGGGGGDNAACCRYGYGFIQGANAAAKELGVKVEMNYTWQYGASFSPSTELYTLVNGWYTNGTQVVFACGGSICNSVFQAAEENNAKTVGVDVDQAGDSATVITSAMKGLASGTEWALGKFYEGKFAEIADTNISLGAKENSVGLPVGDAWLLKKYTQKEYDTLLAGIVDGTVAIDSTVVTGGNIATVEFSNVTVNYQ